MLFVEEALSVLHMTESAFWAMTPITFFAVLEKHNEIERIKNGVEEPKKEKRRATEEEIDRLL